MQQVLLLNTPGSSIKTAKPGSSTLFLSSSLLILCRHGLGKIHVVGDIAKPFLYVFMNTTLYTQILNRDLSSHHHLPFLITFLTLSPSWLPTSSTESPKASACIDPSLPTTPYPKPQAFRHHPAATTALITTARCSPPPLPGCLRAA